MGKRRGQTALHGAMNVVSSLLLCLTFGRLLIVLYTYFGTSRSSSESSNRVPFWFPPPQLQREGPLTPKYHHLRTSSQHTAYSAGRRGEAMPAELEMQLSNLRDSQTFAGDFQKPTSWVGDRGYKDGLGLSSGSSSGSSGSFGSFGSSFDGGGDGGGSSSDVSSLTYAWGQGMKVLVFTMGSIHRTTVGSTSELAAEINFRESLTNTLIEAGVQVEFAASEADLEIREGATDVYSAILVDSRTWAEKGGRLKRRFTGQQPRIFILDPFGFEDPRANLGAPPVQHLTAFPVPVSQQHTFLGYHVGASQSKALPGEPVKKRRQGVIYGKAPLQGDSARVLFSRLADFVELHSTVAPKDAKFWHQSIVYHGHLSPEEWQQLLRESRFIIDLDDSISGQSAVDAVAAGCVYLSPAMARPTDNIYNSQYNHLAQNAKDQYACSFERKDHDSVVECARRALERDLPPLLPQELTKDAHATRVRRIFEPLAVTSVQ